MRTRKISVRIIMILLAVALLGVIPAQAQQKEGQLGFQDIPQNAWYRNRLEQAVNRGLIQGYNKITFAPQDTITYAEFATVMVRILDGSQPAGDNNWYDNYINKAKELGILKGLSVANYGTGIPRQDMMAITINALNIKPIESAMIVFTDVPEKDKQIVNTAFVEYLTQGREFNEMNKIFGYNETATRAELAEMIMRVVEYKEDANAFKEKRKLEVEAIINQFVEDLKSGKTGVGEVDFHRIGREIAEKYGFTTDESSKTGVSIRGNNYKMLVRYSEETSSYSENYAMYDGNIEMGLELMQGIGRYSDSEISKIRDAIFESQEIRKRVFIDIKGRRLQVHSFLGGNTYIDLFGMGDTGDKI